MSSRCRMGIDNNNYSPYPILSMVWIAWVKVQCSANNIIANLTCCTRAWRPKQAAVAIIDSSVPACLPRMPGLGGDPREITRGGGSGIRTRWAQKADECSCDDSLSVTVWLIFSVCIVDVCRYATGSGCRGYEKTVLCNQECSGHLQWTGLLV